MKKSIIINLLLIWSTGIFACGFAPIHNYYLFSSIEKKDWKESINARTLENWRAYAGKSEMYWFDADEIRQVARQKGDGLMISYIDNLQKYLDICTAAQETWNYPTKKELQMRRQTLLGIQKYAFSKTKTRLRSQHALLYMRCNMMLDQHQQNISFWEQTASKFINSVYRDMMLNIYAGALLKSNRSDEATKIFVEQGDIASLYTYYYKKRSFEAIRAEYLHNPNSPAFPFLLQDFANNAQEAYDALHDQENMAGKLFIRNITLKENRQMSQFCDEVVHSGKTTNPVLWQTLRAWLLFLSGDRQKALSASQQALTLEGTERSKINARIIHLFIFASVAPVNTYFDNQLAQELTWLQEKSLEDKTFNVLSIWNDNHYNRVFDRLVHQVLVPRYTAVGRPETAIACLAAYDEIPKAAYLKAAGKTERNERSWNNDYSGDFFAHIDTIEVDILERYFSYTHQAPATPIDQWLSKRIRHDNTFFHELLGTKYLRLGAWQQAINHLEQVPLDFVNTMNIVPFMARRDYHVEPWMQRQRIQEALQIPGSTMTHESQKLRFAQEMLELEKDFNSLNPTEKAKRAYQLAIRYAQASYAGDCWYLTRYGKSYYDAPRTGEINMLQKASVMLTYAQYISDFKWREKTFYAQAWLPFDFWYTEVWNNKTYTYDKQRNTNSRQFRALYTLLRYENDHSDLTSDYVSRCDVLKQFQENL